MISDSDSRVSGFNARSSQQSEASTWIDRAPDAARLMRIEVLRGALARLGEIAWSVAKALPLPIGALLETNALLGLHPTRGEFFEPDPFSLAQPRASDQWP